jgi:SPP1 gp7 family putative phage head morphogenesis protein
MSEDIAYIIDPPVTDDEDAWFEFIDDMVENNVPQSEWIDYLPEHILVENFRTLEKETEDDAMGSLKLARRYKGGETAIHQAADKYLEQVKVAIALAFAVGRKVIDKSKLREALGSKDMHAVSDLLALVPDTVHDTLKTVLPKTLAKVFVSGAHAGKSLLQKQQVRAAAKKDVFKMAFNVTDENVIKWARAYGAKLAKDLSETTRHDIAEALVDAFEEGNTDDLYDEVLAAVGDEDRASMIARTEVMSAANAGQRESWAQAITQGLLSSENKKMWIATAGDLSCPECAVLDGEITSVDGEYPDPGADGPPLHPNCRCTEGIVD